jgi:hypothetical protein
MEQQVGMRDQPSRGRKHAVDITPQLLADARALTRHSEADRLTEARELRREQRDEPLHAAATVLLVIVVGLPRLASAH